MKARISGILFASALVLLTAASAAEKAPADSSLSSQLNRRRARRAGTRLKIMEAARKAFVKVIFTPKWDRNCALELAAGQRDYSYQSFWVADDRNQMTERLRTMTQLHRNRRTLIINGLLIAPGLVLVADDGTGYEWKLVDKIEIENAEGTRWEVAPHLLLRKGSAIVFKVTGDSPPAAPEYLKDFKPAITAGMIGTGLVRKYNEPDKWFITSGGYSAPFAGEEITVDKLVYAGIASSQSSYSSAGLAMLFDEKANPVAVRIGGTVMKADNRLVWAPRKMISEGALPYSRLRTALNSARETSLKLHYKVRFEFRVDKEEDQNNMRWPEGGYGMDDTTRDAETFSVSIGKGRLLVPRTLKQPVLHKVEKISVRVSGQWHEARFVASLKDYDAMILQVPGTKINEPDRLYSEKNFRIMEPFVFCNVRELLGTTQALARTTRFTARRRGYKDRLRPAHSGIPAGALLFDTEGRLTGINLRERRDRELGLSDSNRYYRSELEDLVPFARLKKVLTAPEDHALPEWRPMTDKESKRIVWLGVEFAPVNKDLARRLGVSRPTGGGLVGLMVSTVYPGSPAQQMGLEPQDILLQLRVKGMGDPLPLLSNLASSPMEAGINEMEMMTGEMAMRTWKPRINALTMLLTRAGPGRMAEIEYYSHDQKKVLTGSWNLAYGPVDFDSAEKFKDEQLGLSVKPLTYEVRLALALKPESPGLIISRVEPGSAAQLARLSPYMLITHIQGQPVHSLDDFQAAIRSLRQQKEQKVKLQVSIMGKSRFADLKLSE